MIDGFVVLDDKGTLGLGGHLFEYLERQIPVIGVAKTNYAAINELKREVLRGQSKNPLHITALGIELDVVADCIRMMNGDHRIPLLLKTVDNLTRQI